MTTAPRTDTLYIQSLAKGMRVLECFADHPSPLSLNDIATFCDMDRSAAQRMAYTLVSLGYLERGGNGRGCVLGKKILERACQAQVKATMGGDELVYPSAEVCERTARQFERPTAMAYCERVWKAALRLL